MEEQDFFPEISGFSLPTEAQNILRSQNVNLSQYQKDINDDIAAGGERKNRRIQHTYQLLDKVMGGTYYTERLAASLPPTQREVADSFGNTTGKQNFFGNFWNKSAPSLIEGVGKLGAAIPAIFEADDRDWNARNKAVDEFVKPMLTHVDDAFANASPISWNREKGELDLSNLADGTAWASTVSSLLGFMAPVFVTAGAGAVIRGASAAGKAAQGLNALTDVAELAANGAKLDGIGRAMLGVEFTTSTAMMFPEYQKMGLENGLSIGQATKVALPLAIVNGAIELLGGEAFAKGLGFTTADANKVIREVTRQNADNVLAGLRTGSKLDEMAFQDIVESVARNTVNTLADKSQHPLWKTLINRLGRAAKDQGLPEGAEEFLQGTSEELAKAIYNSTADPSLPEGRGRFGNFDAGEYATTTFFGTFLGGLMGTSMGLLHKVPKVFDQTLFNYIGADVASQIANGAQSFEEIAPKLKAYGLVQKGMDEGHYDEAERDRINSKVENMARTAFEFSQSPEIGKSERYAMYRLTDLQNSQADQESQLQSARQAITEASKQIETGGLSPKALIDANKVINEASKLLGNYDPDTDSYVAEMDLAQRKAATSRILSQTGQAMAIPAKKDVATRYLRNEISAVSNEPMANQNFVHDPNSSFVVIRESDGKSNRLRAAERKVLPEVALSDDLAFTQDPYQPRERAVVEPKPYFDTVDEYSAAEKTYTDGKKIGSEEVNLLTQSPRADAMAVLDLGRNMVQQQNPISGAETSITDTLRPLYDYYQQIQDYDADGKFEVAKFESEEKFFEALGVPTEETVLDAAEAGVDAATLTQSPQPESISKLTPIELAVQANQTNENYDENLVDQQLAAFVKANGIEPEMSIPQWVDVAIRRAESALPMAPEAITEASDYLYRIYRQWVNMKKASGRNYTLDQIDQMIEMLGQDIELLEQYRNAYEDGNPAEFVGRDQTAQTQANTAPAVPDTESGTPAAESRTSTDQIDGNSQTDKPSNQNTGPGASEIQSLLEEEQKRAGYIEDAQAALANAAKLAAEIAESDADFESKLAAAEQALRTVAANLDQIDPDVASESGNQNSGTAGDTAAPIENLTSRQIRRKLEELRRVPQSFREAVLWYFADGGKVRREDAVRFLGVNALNAGKGSNAYLSYISDSAQPYDNIVRDIITSMGYQSVEEVGDEATLTDEMFLEIVGFYGTSPNRILLRMHLDESLQQYEPMFGEDISSDELVAHFSVDESTLDALSPDDIEAFNAFLRTLPDTIDPTDPQQVFDAFLEYSKDGFPPLTESGMMLVDAIAAEGIASDPALPQEYKDTFQPLIEKYNESVRSNDTPTAETGTDSSATGSSTPENPPVESQPVAKPNARRQKLDDKARKLRESIAADWDAFVSPGDTASSSVVGITPKQFEAASRMIINLAELGINRFEDAMLEIIDTVGMDRAAAGFRAFKAAYFSVKANDDNTDEDLNALRKITFEQIAQTYVSSTELPLESDSTRGAVGDPVGTENVQSGTGGNVQPTGNGGIVTGDSGLQFESNSSVPGNTTVTVGNEGDPDLSPSESNDELAERNARRGERERGNEFDGQRIRTESRGADTAVPTPTTNDSRAAKLELQRRAEGIAVETGDLNNIQETLPYLLSHQHTNVLKAETRLLQQNKKGIMFTDGTGTGKTMTALGIAKRFLKRGGKNILIVTPSDKKVKDWVEEASYLGIKATGLKGLDDKGSGVSVTTYANFGQNTELTKRTFDLIIYDESHNLMSNEKGDSTLAVKQHRELSKPARTAYYMAYNEYKDAFLEAMRKERAANDDRNDMEAAKWAAVSRDFSDNKIPARTKELLEQTRVVFLSATPFAYHKNIAYADGFLFNAYQQLDSNYKPLDSGGSGYNSGDEMDKYMMSAFGYRMRYNKLTTPEAGVDVGLMERQWVESLKTAGAVSSTKLDIPQDYSRDFVLLSEEGEKFPIGTMIDEGMRLIHDEEEFKALSQAVNKRMDYLYKNRLLEQIKAKLGIDRIRKHIEAGRKVVVFHSYNEGVASHPFEFSYLRDPEFSAKLDDKGQAFQQAIAFNRKYPQYQRIDLTGLASVPNAIKAAFRDEAVLFNGSVPNKERSDNIKKFNDDNSSVSVVVVNIAAGEAGLNLHDTTGHNQRVVMQLGLPIRPTSAIQSEGRIYRTGQKTNAIFEYLVTHFNFEKYAFGGKINERSGTAENLAMGNEARDLKVSFKEGYLNPVTEDPSDIQGVGGKESDYTRSALTPFQKAITYYFARQKKTAKNKAAEGVDYYATPEPLGMKIVEWLNPIAGQKLAEPSAGHGAIARFFPDSTENIMIEPSTVLRSDLSVNAHGTVIGGTFEQLALVNKFHGIAMNPPYGVGGKVAMEHLQKAIRHLYDGGRIIAIVPTGQFDKRFEKYFYEKNEKGKYVNPEAEYMNLTARILLPSVTFERAGTAVSTQILILDKEVLPDNRSKLPQTRTVDLSRIESINQLFERLENMEMPQKQPQTIQTETVAIPVPEPVPASASPVSNAGGTSVESPDSVRNPVKAFHAQKQKDIFVVQTGGKLSTEEYGRIKGIATRHSGYYSSFKGSGAVPGFQFSTPEAAASFYREITGKSPEEALPPQASFAPPSELSESAFEHTVQLLSQRFESIEFQTPATSEAFIAKQQELEPDIREAAYGFFDPKSRAVWLNPSVPNANTPIHEVAHPWVSWLSRSHPELYARGTELARESIYMRELLRDPRYSSLTLAEMADEALVRAIADQGEKFITPIRKRDFAQWFRELFDSIREFLGFRDISAEQLAQMGLEEFAKRAAADILMGTPADLFENMPTAAGALTDAAVSKPLFSFGQNSFDFTQTGRTDVQTYAEWQEHIDFALAQLPTATLAKTSAQMDSRDKQNIQRVLDQTGVRYKGSGEWDFDLSRSPDTAFLGDGTMIRMDRFGQASNQKGLIATTFRNGFLKLYNQNDLAGKTFRFVVDNMRGLMNIETMASLLDNGTGVITSLINDVKRVGGRNKAYVSNVLNPKRWKIAQLARDFTTYEGANTIWTAKRMEVETYDWDETQQDVVKRRVEIPLATAMSLVLTADTQESMGARYGGTSIVLPDRFIDQNGNLIDFAQINPNATPDQLTQMKKKVIFSEAKNVHRGAKLTHSALEKVGSDYAEIQNLTLLLSRTELDNLRQRFVQGIGITSDAETEVFGLLKEAFNDRQIRQMIKTEHEEHLNYGDDFVVVTDYFPINSADGQAQVNDRLRYRPALEDSKLLNERIAAPKSIYLGDALDTLEDYEYRVGNILEHGRLSHNITTIANALRTEVPDDPMVRQLTQWMLDRRELIEDWRGYKAARQDRHKWAKPINLILSRYTSSIFRLNFGMATKQLATYYSASGQSMLKDEYLFRAEGYKNLLTLSRGMITDTVTGVGAEVVEGTDVGFVDAMGNKSSQADVLRELLGENIQDDTERELHRRRFATVIERVLYSQNAYVGGVDLDKVTFNSKGLGLMQKLFGRADQWMENIGMAPMRISDRAVILSYYLAAKEQVQDEVNAGIVPPAQSNQRIAEVLESALYATNQMNKVADMTTMQTSTNWLTKLLGLYSGQTQKLLNVFMQAFVNWAHNPQDVEAKARFRKAFISNAIVVPMYLAGVTTLWSVLKAIANGDEPKDYSYYQDQYLWNIVRNVSSVVPGLSEQVGTTIISNFDNEPWNDGLLEYPGDEIVNATVGSFKDLYQWGAAEDTHEAGKYADSFYYNVEKAMSGWTGTPKVVTRFVREHTTTDADD